jgi:peroxiredoxin
LRRWKELQTELDAYGVELVTLCADTPAQIRKGRAKHGLDAVMLSDHDLSVTRELGLENRNPAVKPPGLVGLPIPTTILTDRQGIVRWIDQADDYTIRSQPERVRAALEQALGA